ncbi:MAG: RluA family pseudouridine synthase [Erysipelotrichia bacterium]|nr:RluA family pseudouridine synthase [Erysipelotrichia bacterium]
MKRQVITVQTLYEFLINIFHSKKNIYLMKQEKRIKVNDKIITGNCLLTTNDFVNIDVLKDEEINIQPVKSTLEILYEDEYLLVVNKPLNLIIHDDQGTNALDNYVAYYYLTTNQKHKVYHIHRLDKDTSGCILYCKQPYLVPIFDDMLEKKKIQRTYVAIAEGIIKNKMTINKPIGSDRHQNNRYVVSAKGKEAITVITPLKQLGSNTLISCQLKTGRTHQIRVHLAYINHPLIGDKIYGHTNAQRLMLHSYSLKFVHPITEQAINIICPVDF